MSISTIVPPSNAPIASHYGARAPYINDQVTLSLVTLVVHTESGTVPSQAPSYGSILGQEAFAHSSSPSAVSQRLESSWASERHSSATPTSTYVPTSGFSVSRIIGSPATGLLLIWTPAQIFVSYFPVLIAVLYRIFWSVVTQELALIEPFRQISSPTGAKASGALFTFYQRRVGLFEPITLVSKKRWILLCSSLACLVASFIPALASEAIWVDTDYNCGIYHQESSNNPCPARMAVSLVVVRIIQALLVGVALLAIPLVWCLKMRRTGLIGSPRSIAAVARLMQHPTMVEDMGAVRVDLATTHKVSDTMRRRRYKLEQWNDESGRAGYGIRPVDEISVHEKSYSTSNLTNAGNTTGSLPGEGQNLLNNARHRGKNQQRWKYTDFILLLTVCGAFAVVLAYFLDWRDDPFNRFFNSNKFGPRFILTGAATVIASMWKTMEHSIMIIAPFTRMSKRPSSYNRTIAFSPTTTPFISTWNAMRNRYWLAATVTIIAFMVEALNLVISGVPYATGMTWTQLLVCAYMTLSILGLLIVTLILVIIHRLREPQIPIPPESLGAKMSHLAGSSMLKDFEGIDPEDKQMEVSGKRYGFRPTITQDGNCCWMVDVHDEVWYRE